jgi:predicted nucleic acid-binding protein
VIFVDSNIPMYLIGATHRHKVDAQRLLERAIADRERLVTDAEVFQEILHRYTAIDRRDAIQPAFDVLEGIADQVFPVTLAEVERAKTIVLGRPALRARDAIHVAVMERHGVTRVMSFDSDFDRMPGLARLA